MNLRQKAKLRSSQTLKSDIAIGVRIGLQFAAACGLLATTGFVIAYATGNGRAMTQHLGMNWPTVMLVYSLGGLIGGVIVGLLRPLRATTLGSFVIGTFGSYPISLGFVPAAVPRSNWYTEGLLVALGASMLIGGGLGTVFHDDSDGWSK